ncbi:hypothetical protein OY671_008836, partial [Metschnikowia pulcherrima]
PEVGGPVGGAARNAVRAAGRGEGPMDTGAAAGRSGAVKQALMQRTRASRARFPASSRGGSCEPVAARGARAGNVMACSRRHAGMTSSVMVPRSCATASSGQARGDAPAGAAFWEDTQSQSPDAANSSFEDPSSGQSWRCGPAGELAVATASRASPVALGSASRDWFHTA